MSSENIIMLIYQDSNILSENENIPKENWCRFLIVRGRFYLKIFTKSSYYTWTVEVNKSIVGLLKKVLYYKSWVIFPEVQCLFCVKLYNSLLYCNILYCTSYSFICTTCESELDLGQVQLVTIGDLRINLGLIFHLGSVGLLHKLTEPKWKIKGPNLLCRHKKYCPEYPSPAVVTWPRRIMATQQVLQLKNICVIGDIGTNTREANMT